MKALLFKELKLSLHPICYIFIFLFPFMILIPNYPLCVGFIYVLCCYPIIFLGANKGVQTNDLLYTTLMPVRKKDIVLARLITLSYLLVLYIIMILILLPLAGSVNADIINQAITDGVTVPEIPGLGLDCFAGIIGITLICLAITDLIYLTLYYRNGKSIVLPTLISIFGFTLIEMTFTMILPLEPAFAAYTNFVVSNQALVLIIGIVFYLALRFVTYKICSKLLERVDF